MAVISFFLFVSKLKYTTFVFRLFLLDVIVAEVRATSHKPDEIYGIIERLSPGSRKIELFGRPHNVQPNWITLGNQLDGIRLVDPELITQFQKRYPDGNCMAPATTTTTAVVKK